MRSNIDSYTLILILHCIGRVTAELTSNAEDVAIDSGAAPQAAPTGGNRHRQIGVGGEQAHVARDEAGM